jgi:hypothetical protein
MGFMELVTYYACVNFQSGRKPGLFAVKERSMMNRSYDSKKGKQINHGSEL